jgi:hypothetical protein
VRFENFWETDSEGNTLPYLDGMIGRPQGGPREVTALRAGKSTSSTTSPMPTPSFIKDYGKTYETWPVPQVGTARSPSISGTGRSPKDNPDALMLRQAAAHAIDHEGIQGGVQQAGRIAKGHYSKSSRGTARIKSWPNSVPTRPRRCARRPRTATPSC